MTYNGKEKIINDERETEQYDLKLSVQLLSWSKGSEKQQETVAGGDLKTPKPHLNHGKLQSQLNSYNSHSKQL